MNIKNLYIVYNYIFDVNHEGSQHLQCHTYEKCFISP